MLLNYYSQRTIRSLRMLRMFFSGIWSIVHVEFILTYWPCMLVWASEKGFYISCQIIHICVEKTLTVLICRGRADFQCPYWDLLAGRVPARRGRSSWCRWWRWWGPRCCEGWKPSAGPEASRTWRGPSSHPASAGTYAPMGSKRSGIRVVIGMCVNY